jgi:hypothetical protein
MFLSTNNEIFVRILSLRTLYYKMIKAFVFFIKNRNRSFDLSRLTRSHSRTICLRIWIDSSNCDAMFSSCSSNSWSHYSLTSFCFENLSYCFRTRFVAKSMKNWKEYLISNVRFFFFFDFDHFSFRENDFRVRDRDRERCCRRIDNKSKHVENDLRFAHEV